MPGTTSICSMIRLCVIARSVPRLRNVSSLVIDGLQSATCGETDVACISLLPAIAASGFLLPASPILFHDVIGPHHGADTDFASRVVVAKLRLDGTPTPRSRVARMTKCRNTIRYDRRAPRVSGA